MEVKTTLSTYQKIRLQTLILETIHKKGGIETVDKIPKIREEREKIPELSKAHRVSTEIEIRRAYSHLEKLGYIETIGGQIILSNQGVEALKKGVGEDKQEPFGKLPIPEQLAYRTLELMEKQNRHSKIAIWITVIAFIVSSILAIF